MPQLNMEPRLTRSEWQRNQGEGNRKAMKRLVVERSRAPGLLAYLEGEPVGWISIEPRGVFGRLARSRER